ncbi:hypothetical protein ACHAW6_007395 [Cyclotella cf. meneghiniana]
MANEQKPITCTRHMDIRYSVLTDWVECDIMILELIHSNINMANHPTKILDMTLL